MLGFLTQKFRKQSGYVIAENASAIIVLFLGLLFPLIDLATAGLRYSLLMKAVHDGAHASLSCLSFSSGSSPSAVLDIVPVQITKSLLGVSGVTNTTTTVQIISSRISDGAVIVNTPNQKLSAPADTLNYLYANQVTVKAQLAPFITYTAPFLPSIPTLNAPFTTSISCQEISDNPQGLNR